MVFPFSGGKIASDENGNTHDPSDAHEGSHTEFKGLQPEDVCSDGACFINFRSSSDKGINFNQPSVYGAFSQNLRSFSNGKKGAWEINDSGKLTFEVQKPQTLTLVPQRDGQAVSKAMVYFHRLDTWQAPPNLFDPYWRSKLHPFSRDEMKSVIENASFEDADAISGQTPIEGAQ